MARSVAWQRCPSDAVSWHQDEALNSTIYILREIGPTSFLLKEEGERKKFKVALGDPHVCNCWKFQKERSLCKHICWILLKKFKLDRFHELAYQLGLVEREIHGLLKCPPKPTVKVPATSNEESDQKNILEQRSLTSDDVCPVCQEQLLAKHQPVTYCKYGCGNSIHIKCMKVWADHQRQTTGSTDVICPFCREDFGSYDQLNKEYQNLLTDQFRARTNHSDGLASHFGFNCNGCNMVPIKGKCYQCTSCNEGYHLCNTCYHAQIHGHHIFVYRLKKSQRWRPAPSRNYQTGRRQDAELFLGGIAQALQTRELNENDYDMLLQLDSSQGPTNNIPVALAGLPEHIINQLPLSKVLPNGRLLAAGRQCRLCLRAYAVGQLIRKLPNCKHVFHRECIDKWLTEDHRCCPIDGQSVEINQDDVVESRRRSRQSSASNQNPKLSVKTGLAVGDSERKVELEQLVIPGLGLFQLSSNSASSSITSQPSAVPGSNQQTSGNHRRGNLHRHPVHSFLRRQERVTSAPTGMSSSSSAQQLTAHDDDFSKLTIGELVNQVDSHQTLSTDGSRQRQLHQFSASNHNTVVDKSTYHDRKMMHMLQTKLVSNDGVKGLSRNSSQPRLNAVIAALARQTTENQQEQQSASASTGDQSQSRSAKTVRGSSLSTKMPKQMELFPRSRAMEFTLSGKQVYGGAKKRREEAAKQRQEETWSTLHTPSVSGFSNAVSHQHNHLHVEGNDRVIKNQISAPVPISPAVPCPSPDLN